MKRAVLLMFEEGIQRVTNKIDDVKDIRELVPLYEEAVEVIKDTVRQLDKLEGKEEVVEKHTPTAPWIISTKDHLIFYTKCKECGRDQKYVTQNSLMLVCKYGHGSDRSSMPTPINCAESKTIEYPCLHDNVKPGTITSISCTCPRCSPRC